MAINGPNGFDFTQLNQVGGTSAATDGARAAGAAGIDSFALELAQFKSQQLGALLGTSDSDVSGIASLQSGAQASASDPLSMLASIGQARGLSAGGTNTALRDPASAYNMMSQINNFDVTFKAQFAELSQMQSGLQSMGQAGQSLGGIGMNSDSGSIQSQLQAFADQYNGWVKQFDGDVQSGGLLANTQAAEVARYELRQNIENVFNGADHGVRGMGDLGLDVDANTGLVSLDTQQLGSMLAGNKAGAVSAIQQFSANFVKSAEMINSAGNFMPNQLGNLSRAISYIDSNEKSLQAEFGSGDAASPSGKTAAALALYKQMVGTAS